MIKEREEPKMTPSSKKTIITPARVIALGFILVILTGSVLLSLPAAHSGNGKVEYLDALFTSRSSHSHKIS